MEAAVFTATPDPTVAVEGEELSGWEAVVVDLGSRLRGAAGLSPPWTRRRPAIYGT